MKPIGEILIMIGVLEALMTEENTTEGKVLLSSKINVLKWVLE